jgi:site-specific recombinase XerC
MNGMPAPILSKPIMPSLAQDQVLMLLEKADNIRDKAMTASFTGNGLRLLELTEGI